MNDGSSWPAIEVSDAIAGIVVNRRQTTWAVTGADTEAG